MRMMSFALTERQLLDGSKTVTRRTGWRNLRPGEHLLAVRKAMGLKRGEKVQPLCVIEVVSVRREMLCRMEPEDCGREGFPHLDVADFIAMFCEHHKVEEAGRIRRMQQYDVIMRIEFRVVPDSIRVPVQGILC